MTRNETPAAESTGQLAKRIFVELHRTILSHEAGALDGEVESVHDMRVAIRRLRVALSNFAVCLPKEDRKSLRSHLKHLADALGGVRDLDVMIEALKASLRNRSDQEKIAISAMIRRLKARRRSRLRTLINYLSGEEYAGFKREFSSEQVKAETAEHNLLREAEDQVIKEHGQAA